MRETDRVPCGILRFKGMDVNTPIVTVCPGGVVTGGPEAQHQLIDMVNQIFPGNGYVCYTPFDEIHSIPEPYKRYNAPTIRRQDIPNDALIVIPEIWPHLVEEFQQPCAFWWLSVDSFWSWSGNTSAMRKAAVQVTQSEYARQHVAEVHGLDSLMLTDYINLEFGNTVEAVKRPRVAVNPSKGKHLIDEFRVQFPEIEIIELAGMSREQVQRELAESAIYIDFGHHPGRDRLPREAALSHVVVLTTKIGSAANDVDVPLDNWYKFDSVKEAGEKSRAILRDIQFHVEAQRPYFKFINGQHDAFRHEVEELIRIAPTLKKSNKTGVAGMNEDEYLGQYFERPWYVHCVYYAASHAKKLGYDAISIAEFGVAGGNGLVLLERYAAEVSELVGIQIEVYGFDRGVGLPRPTDYRDQPFVWREGYYLMDEEALNGRLTSAKLVLGDISETSKSFFEDYRPAPIGAVFFDVDMYSSTKDALQIFNSPEQFRAPRIFCYFDDIFGNINTLNCDYTGERLAINEFNSENGSMKISPAYYLHYSSMSLKDNIFIQHDFAHSKYNQYMRDESFQSQLPLS